MKQKMLHKNFCGKPMKDDKGNIQVYCGEDLDEDKFAQCPECREKDFEDENEITGNHK